MIYTKPQPIGIDVPIQRAQRTLYENLITLWGISEDKYNAYGRAYRNQVPTGYAPEVFKGGIEYGDPLLNDNIAVTSFWGVAGTQRHKLGRSIANVHVIFHLNIQKVKPAVLHRADEEIHQDILQILRDHKYLYDSIDSTEQWMDNVFREYSSIAMSKTIKYRDNHPYHCFRVNMTMIYQDSNCV